MKHKSLSLKSLPVLIALAALIAAYGCKEQDEMFRRYIIEGGITYPAMALNAKARTGKERVEISWPNTDPTVTNAKIYWNNYQDSVLVDIPTGTDMVMQMVNVPEGQYSFFIKTYDAWGNESVPAEVFGRSVGNNYINSLIPRNITNLRTTGGSNLTILWDAAGDVLYSNVVYTSVGNEKKTVRVDASESATTIDDYQLSNSFSYNTVYKPDTLAIDVFPTEFKKVTGIYLLLDKSAGRVIDKSSTWPDPSCLESGAYDGNTGSRWHSLNSGYPHFITVDLGAEISVARFAVWPSIFDGTPDKRMPSRIRWEVSTDNTNWTSLGEFDYDYSQNNWDPRVFDVIPTNARYVKLWGLNDPMGSGIMCLGEIDVYIRLGE